MRSRTPPRCMECAAGLQSRHVGAPCAATKLTSADVVVQLQDEVGSAILFLRGRIRIRSATGGTTSPRIVVSSRDGATWSSDARTASCLVVKWPPKLTHAMSKGTVYRFRGSLEALCNNGHARRARIVTSVWDAARIFGRTSELVLMVYSQAARHTVPPIRLML